MKTNSFLNVLDSVDNRIKKMEEYSRLTRFQYTNGQANDAYESALRLEEVSESNVLLTRVLPAYTGNPKADDEVKNIIRLLMPIEVGFTVRGWFSLRIPALLPRKERGSVEYIRRSLYIAMEDFFRDKQPVRYIDCVICYRHIYSRDRPEREMRDHDNYEINAVTDIVAMYTLPDDSPKFCSHYYTSAAGSVDRTEVYVVPKNNFPIWFQEEKSMPDKGVKLYEHRI